MSNHIQTATMNGLRIHIDHDQFPTDPREFDNLGTMVCFHRRYNLGDPHAYHAANHAGWDELAAHIRRDHPGAVILPLYLFDHSGLTISTDDRMFSACDPAGWDWGQVGFVFVSLQKIRREYEVQEVSRELRSRVEQLLRAEVDEYARYLRGKIYRYTIEGPGGDVLDSCCGFMSVDYAVEEAQFVTETLSA